MKKLSSILMLAMLCIAALCFNACGGGDDDNNGGNSSNDEGYKESMTLLVDGGKYYAADCSAQQTKGNGMYLIIHAVTNAEYPWNGKELIAHISPNKVADLTEGQVFKDNSIKIQKYRGLSEIEIDTYNWKVITGTITIKKITKMEMTIEINMQIEHKNSSVKHTICGTAVLDSGVYNSNNTLLSFEDAIK